MNARARIRGAGVALLVLAGAAARAHAQGADSAAYFAPSGGALARVHLAPYGDLRLRDDDVWNRPGFSDELHRQRATLRGGLVWAPPAFPLRLEAGVRAALGSDHTNENWSPFENEAPDTVHVDRLGGRLADAAGDAIVAGKLRQPLAFSELIWDPDLRPIGVGVLTRGAWLGAPWLRAGAGAFTRAHLPSEDVHAAIAQLAVVAPEAARVNGGVTLSALGFDHTDELIAQGLQRQNTVVVRNGRRVFATDFSLLDAQLDGLTRLGRVPFEAHVDLVRNTAAPAHRDGVRVRAAIGGEGVPLGSQLGYAYERIERDAVLGAFNSDDWWFHSRMRGHLAWVQLGSGLPVSLRVMGFIEWRDDLAEETRRVIAELTLRLPEP